MNKKDFEAVFMLWRMVFGFLIMHSPLIVSAYELFSHHQENAIYLMLLQIYVCMNVKKEW